MRQKRCSSNEALPLFPALPAPVPCHRQRSPRHSYNPGSFPTASLTHRPQVPLTSFIPTPPVSSLSIRARSCFLGGLTIMSLAILAEICSVMLSWVPVLPSKRNISGFQCTKSSKDSNPPSANSFPLPRHISLKPFFFCQPPWVITIVISHPPLALNEPQIQLPKRLSERN